MLRHGIKPCQRKYEIPEIFHPNTDVLRDDLPGLVHVLRLVQIQQAGMGDVSPEEILVIFESGFLEQVFDDLREGGIVDGRGTLGEPCVPFLTHAHVEDFKA